MGSVTQVVGTGEIQLFHTRLTHSLKVAQIGRRVAQRLQRSAGDAATDAAGGIDAEVVEAACLAHDIGHPPFGHVGEDELQKSLTAFDLDSFEGNPQSFRIVSKLSIRSLKSDLHGLNLTRATLRALLKYPWRFRDPAHHPKSSQKWGAYESEETELEFALANFAGLLPSPEAKLMDWADDITYAVHDTEDFFRAGIIPLDRLATSQTERRLFTDYVHQVKPNWDESSTQSVFDRLARSVFPNAPYTGSVDDRAGLHDFASTMITRYLRAISLSANGDLELEPNMLEEIEILKQLTWCYVIDNPSLATLQLGHRRVTRELFEALMPWAVRGWTDPQDLARLPRQLRNLLAFAADDAVARGDASSADSLCARAAADYIATLTEQQALGLHERITGATGGSVGISWLQR